MFALVRSQNKKASTWTIHQQSGPTLKTVRIIIFINYSLSLHYIALNNPWTDGVRFGHTLPLQNDLYKSETIQRPQRSLSSESELVLTNGSKTRDLESNLDKTVLYHYFEVSFVWRNYMGSL